MPTTKRLLTDETGQALVTAINNIVAAVKPNATEIQMSSSDTTTVATAISNINNKIGTVPSGQTVEGQITTLNSKFAINGNWIANADLDNYKSSGFYMISSENSHAPYTWGFLIVVACRSDTALQICESGRNIALREFRDTAWSEWKAFTMGT